MWFWPREAAVVAAANPHGTPYNSYIFGDSRFNNQFSLIGALTRQLVFGPETHDPGPDYNRAGINFISSTLLGFVYKPASARNGRAMDTISASSLASTCSATSDIDPIGGNNWHWKLFQSVPWPKWRQPRNFGTFKICASANQYLYWLCCPRFLNGLTQLNDFFSSLPPR